MKVKTIEYLYESDGKQYAIGKGDALKHLYKPGMKWNAGVNPELALVAVKERIELINRKPHPEWQDMVYYIIELEKQETKMTEEQIRRILKAGHSVLCNVWDNHSPIGRVTKMLAKLSKDGRCRESNDISWDHAEIHPSVANRYVERDGIIYKWLTIFEADEAEKFIGKKCLFVDCPAIEIIKAGTLTDICRDNAYLFCDSAVATLYMYVAVPLTEQAETPKQKQLRELKEKVQGVLEQIQRIEE